MYCPICKGSGLSPSRLSPLFPSEYGGYAYEVYEGSDTPASCSKCHGSCFVDDGEVEDRDADEPVDEFDSDNSDIDDLLDKMAALAARMRKTSSELFGTSSLDDGSASLLASAQSKQREILDEISGSTELPPQLKSDLYRSLEKIDLASAGAEATLEALHKDVEQLKDQAFLQVGSRNLGQAFLLESFLTSLWSHIGSLRRMLIDSREGR